MTMFVIISLYCALVVGVSLLGGMAPLALVLTHTRLQIYLSFSAGSMLGAAFFHMLPESVEMGGAGTVRWASLGLLVLFLLERFFSFHQHEPAEPIPHAQHDHDHEHVHDHKHDHGHHSDPEPLVAPTLSWGTATFGLAVHSLVGGVALASAVAADYKEQGRIGGMAWGVFLATVLHKPADAMTVVSLMIRAGVPARLAHLVNLGFALMIPMGAALFFLGVDRLDPGHAEALTAVALSFSAGTFLCISLSDLLPELQFHSHDRLKLSIALLAGFFLMAGTSGFEAP
ncbi:ZIP family metal transporter [Paludisphaera rhizosphaerae]|uniref:ZIP family metal transporter n=1 Tax=Paludisphaera rhizosphaerae TaxID=2711216 RepID=UPI001F10CBD3|nr:ZIP family metal transporter [Paludisphaera rhizosphaerae]